MVWKKILPIYQIRVIWFIYIISSSSSFFFSFYSSSFSSFSSSFSSSHYHLRQLYIAVGISRLQLWAPDRNRHRRIAIKQGARDRSGQLRASLQWIVSGLNGNLPSGMGNADPQSRIREWNRQYWISTTIKNNKKIIPKYIRQECQKICQKKYQKIC